MTKSVDVEIGILGHTELGEETTSSIFPLLASMFIDTNCPGGIIVFDDVFRPTRDAIGIAGGEIAGEVYGANNR